MGSVNSSLARIENIANHMDGLSIIGKILNFLSTSSECESLKRQDVDQASVCILSRSMKDVYWLLLICGMVTLGLLFICVTKCFKKTISEVSRINSLFENRLANVNLNNYHTHNNQGGSTCSNSCQRKRNTLREPRVSAERAGDSWSNPRVTIDMSSDLQDQFV